VWAVESAKGEGGKETGERGKEGKRTETGEREKLH
jgi:hypothetical protein